MVLMYHNIGHTPGFYTVAADAFRQQMQYVSEHYSVVDADTYIATIQQTGRNNPRQVAVTFDDAYSSYAELAMPVMEQFKVPSALFVSTDFLGKTNEWDAPKNRHPIMTGHGLQLAAQNPLVTIGAHSKSHRPLARVMPEELTTELIESKRILEQLITIPVHYLAYPFGQPSIDLNRRVIDAVKQAGYRAAFSTDYAIANRQKDCFALHRIEVSPKDSLEDFKARFKPFQVRYFKQQLKNFYYALKAS